MNDFANLLTDKQEQSILDASQQAFNESGASLVVATVNGTDGEDIEAYAKKMVTEYKIIDKSVLILLSKENGKFAIVPGEAYKRKLTPKQNCAYILIY